MKQLILVEGLPGTGKTTATQKLTDLLTAKGETVLTLFEGDDRIPSDFYEMAGIPIMEFESFRARHPEVPDSQWGLSLRTKNYVYLRLDRCDNWIEKTFRKWDMGDECNRQISVVEYIACTMERVDQWVASNLDNGDTVIIDSGFLQNPINELLFRKASDEQVCSFINRIAQAFRPMNPTCFYLKRENAEIAISFAQKAKGPDWTARVGAILQEAGCPDLFTHRFELELQLLPCIPHVICSVSGNDWSDMDAQAQRIF